MVEEAEKQEQEVEGTRLPRLAPPSQVSGWKRDSVPPQLIGINLSRRPASALKRWRRFISCTTTPPRTLFFSQLIFVLVVFQTLKKNALFLFMLL